MLHASMLPRSLAVLLVVAVVCAAAVGGRDLAQYGDEVEDGLVRSCTNATVRVAYLYVLEKQSCDAHHSQLSISGQYTLLLNI